MQYLFGLSPVPVFRSAAMPLPSLTVLTFTSTAPNAVPRLVDIGLSSSLSFSKSAESPAHGAYALRTLAPSACVQTWRREGAHFSMSLMGSIRVWNRQRLLASECTFDREAHGAAPLAAEDIAYLEAYLLFENRAARADHPRFDDKTSDVQRT